MDGQNVPAILGTSKKCDFLFFLEEGRADQPVLDPDNVPLVPEPSVLDVARVKFQQDFANFGLTMRGRVRVVRRRRASAAADAQSSDEDEDDSDSEYDDGYNPAPEPPEPAEEQAQEPLVKPECCRLNCLESIPDQSIRSRREMLAGFKYMERKVFFLIILGAYGYGDNRSKILFTHNCDHPVVCRAAFLWIHEVSHNLVESVRRTIRDRGLVIQPHGRTRSQPGNRIPMEDCRLALDFLMNFAEAHGMPSPGRDRRINDSACLYLPPTFKKIDIWRLYLDALDEGNALYCPNLLHF